MCFYAGGGQHVGAKHEVHPLDFDRLRPRVSTDFVALATPPRVLTVEEQFPNVEEDEEEEKEENDRIPNGWVCII